MSEAARYIILHLHGGWFNFGSAKAYRNLGTSCGFPTKDVAP